MDVQDYAEAVAERLWSLMGAWLLQAGPGPREQAVGLVEATDPVAGAALRRRLETALK